MQFGHPALTYYFHTFLTILVSRLWHHNWMPNDLFSTKLRPRPPTGPLRNRPRFQAFRVLIAMVIREMNTRFGRTWGGYIWAVLEPVAMIGLLSLAFSQFIQTPPIGSSFVLFYATGYVPFYFYSEIANATSPAVVFNKPLMQFPAVTPLDAVFAVGPDINGCCGDRFYRNRFYCRLAQRCGLWVGIA